MTLETSVKSCLVHDVRFMVPPRWSSVERLLRVRKVGGSNTRSSLRLKNWHLFFPWLTFTI